MIGRASYSIDQQRYNAQFGAQICYEVRGGKIVGQLKDVAYVMRTPEFWNSIDLIGGKSSYELGGTFNDGKGQPGQANAVSHGCPPCRFKQHQRHQHGAHAVSASPFAGAPKRLIAQRDAARARRARRPSSSRAPNARTSWSARSRLQGRRLPRERQQFVRHERALRRQPDVHVGHDGQRIDQHHVVFGKRSATVLTNDLSPRGLEQAVAQSEALARLAPEDPSTLPELGPQQYTRFPPGLTARPALR
jgi:hypothetical protein